MYDKEKLYALIDEYWKDYNTKKQDEDVSKFIVEKSIPIIWFGNIDEYNKERGLKVITVGANPSSNEFLDKKGNYVNRFKGAENLNDINSDKDINTLINGYNMYFDFNPYDGWFNKGYEKLLKIFPESKSVSYGYDKNANNRAIHIDCETAIATDPAWGNLHANEKNKLKDTGEKLFKELLKILNPHVVLFCKNDYMKRLFEVEDISPKYKFYGNDKKEYEIYSCKKDDRVLIWGPNPIQIPWMWLNSNDLHNKEEMENIFKDMGLL